MELTILVFLPAAAAAAIMVLPRSMEQNAKWLALTATVAMLALSVQMFFAFDLNASGYQMVVDKKWVTIDQFELRYVLGVDGLSMPLVLLTTCLSVASVLVSFSITKRPRAYFACLMLLVSSVVGVFVSLDFLLFFLFLGTRTLPDVPAHRRLGLRPQGILRDQVRPLHDCRLGLHARRHPDPRLRW